MNKLEKFLSDTNYQKGSYHHALKKFLKKRKTQLAPASVMHLFTTLHPMGEALSNPQTKTLTPRKIKHYVDTLWLKYSAGTIRPIVGDIKQFSRWCKKRKLSKDFAKRLKKPKARSKQANKAPDEKAVETVVRHLRHQIGDAVYRDVFGQLQNAESHHWTEAQTRALRDLFILSFLYETGCRGGELSNLPARAMIEACANPAEAYCIVMGIGKTADHDYLFTQTTADLWRLWDGVRDKSILFAVYGWKRGSQSQQIKTNGISQMLVRRCKAAGVKHFRCHSQRHAKIKRARKIAGLEIAQVLVDHADPETTWGYANIDDDELITAVKQTGIRYDLWA